MIRAAEKKGWLVMIHSSRRQVRQAVVHTPHGVHSVPFGKKTTVKEALAQAMEAADNG